MWLSNDDWKFVQSLVPIACVDVLPIRLSPQLSKLRFDVGLIYRETPHQGRRWCLIGGRLLRNEALCEAISRQLREALGPDVYFDVTEDIQPVYVAQYFSEPRQLGGVDPRQHAVGLIFAVSIEGNVQLRGEAISFQWFQPTALPTLDEVGFNQHDVLVECIKRLGTCIRSPGETIHEPSDHRRPRSKIP